MIKEFYYEKKCLIFYDNFGSGHRVTANIVENMSLVPLLKIKMK
ncbi:MAG TPA: hypothetical protein PLK71_02830 [Candidatus Paceibacterota bacterium]|nr:hypothetical protein [Candidatus Paceibacterota bacterium]